MISFYFDFFENCLPESKDNAHSELKDPNFLQQVRIHKMSRDLSNHCPPCHSDTPLATSGSISRIFDQKNVLRTNGLMDGQTDQRTDGHTLL